MQLFLRLVPENENSTMDDLAKAVTELLQDKPSLHMYAPIVSHHRGGYCVYLECPDVEAERRAIAESLIANGWLLCF